jgi:hypothetical protein
MRTLPLRDKMRRSNCGEQLTIPAMKTFGIVTLQSLPAYFEQFTQALPKVNVNL